MKEEFKAFVRNNPKLVEYVKKNDTSWQDLYEVYALYGEEKSVWEKYLTTSNSGIDELLKMIKNVNLDSVKNMVDSLQKAIGILQGLSKGNDNNSYEAYSPNIKYEDLDD